MAVGWTGIASGEPLMFMLGIDDGAYTYEWIRATRSFVVAFPSERMGAAVLHAGSVHGRGRDKLAEAGLATAPALRVPAPLLADAVANFECELVDVVKPGDCPLMMPTARGGPKATRRFVAEERRNRLMAVPPLRAKQVCFPISGRQRSSSLAWRT
jgi:hypothetical protein